MNQDVVTLSTFGKPENDHVEYVEECECDSCIAQKLFKAIVSVGGFIHPKPEHGGGEQQDRGH